MHTRAELQERQALPLNLKIAMTKTRIREWISFHGVDGVYVSFSGGKDSTVLVDIITKIGYDNVPLVFVDTGLEYPEIREFVGTYGDRVTWVKPQMNFRKVIEKYGYPVISKDVAQCVYDVNTQAKRYGCDKRETKLWHRSFDPEGDYTKKYPQYSRVRYDFLNDAPFPISHKCCDQIKKKPSKVYEKETGRVPIIATMASESRIRTTQWLIDGCNAFNVKRPTSKPMSFWTEQDVLKYIKLNNLQICSVYGDIVEDVGEKKQDVDGQLSLSDVFGFENVGLFDDKDAHPFKTTGCSRTGCMFCLFGCFARDYDNFERMKETHPKQYEWIMKPWNMGGLGYKDVIDWLNDNGNMDIRY